MPDVKHTTCTNHYRIRVFFKCSQDSFFPISVNTFTSTLNEFIECFDGTCCRRQSNDCSNPHIAWPRRWVRVVGAGVEWGGGWRLKALRYCIINNNITNNFPIDSHTVSVRQSSHQPTQVCLSSHQSTNCLCQIIFIIIYMSFLLHYQHNNSHIFSITPSPGLFTHMF